MAGLLAFTLVLYLFGDGPGPSIQRLEDADLVARVDSRGRTTVVVGTDDPYDLDVVTFEVVDAQPIVTDAPVSTPPLGRTVDVVIYDRPSWWEDGVEDGQLVAFLAHTPDRAGPPWTLRFALDARSGRITGEFDDDWSQDTYEAVATEAGARTPQERIEALVSWAGEAAGQRPEAWTVEEVSTFYVGQAVARDVDVERDDPFDVAAWQAQPADERLLPVGPDDPALDVLQPQLKLRSVAVGVRPNNAFDSPVTEVALEFVGTGLLGWIPLREGEPTGVVGAAPVTEDVRVRVLGRTPDGEVETLQLFGDEVGADRSTPVWWLSCGMAEPGPWALVIDLEQRPAADGGNGVTLRQTTIHELGLLMERAGR